VPAAPSGWGRSPAVVYASVGHFLHHVLTGLFLTLAVVLERAWALPYDEVIALWAWGALLVGLGAPAAGWLADRVGEAWMMAAFFLGAGAATVAAGAAAGPGGMAAALAALGLFGAIYHPVGLSWVSKAAPEGARGRVIGLVGIAGSLGVAAAALVAGGLAGLAGWRAALAVPGVVSVAVGGVLALSILRGRVAREAAEVGRGPAEPAAAGGGADGNGPGRVPAVVLVVLAVTFSLGSVLYGALSTATPKWMSEALSLGAEEPARLGLLVGLVLLAGSAGQLLGGALADRRWSLKWLYALTLAAKAPLLLAAALAGGPAAVLAAAGLFLMLDLGAPVENLLLARYSSGRRRGLAFGVKFAMGFAAAPLGVGLVAALWGAEGVGGGFGPFFLVLAALALLMLLAALFLPGEPRRAAGVARGPAAAPAE
jgi:MFS transporter, FSR family, fosmidomycin resistance protein